MCKQKKRGKGGSCERVRGEGWRAKGWQVVEGWRGGGSACKKLKKSEGTKKFSTPPNKKKVIYYYDDTS